MTTAIRANVLILGKTGVGKTALFNYLFGQEILATGAGRPVTGMGLFEEEVVLDSGLTLHLYDSWGMEADKTQAWRDLVNEALSKHQGRKIGDCFHTIIFCISAKSARVEDFELEMIKTLKDSGHPLIIALTHADISDQEGSLLAMRQVLIDQTGLEMIIAVNSLQKTLLGGRQTRPFGKSEMLTGIQVNLLETIKRRVPQSVRAFGQDRIEAWFSDCYHLIKDDVSFFNPVSGKKEKNRNAYINAYARSIFSEIDNEAKTLFYQAIDYFMAFSEFLLDKALVATTKLDGVMPFIAFELEKNARLATEIIGNVFTFIPVLGAFGKQFIRKKSQKYYLQGLAENRKLLENQLDRVVKILEEEVGKLESLLNKNNY